MDKTKIIEAIKKVRETTSKKKFDQTFDLSITLKEIDIKNPEHKVDVFITLPHGRGKKRKLCALVGDSLFTEAKTVFDKVILKSDFKNIPKKEVKKIAIEYDGFIAQGDIMGDIATTFGKALGVRGKMPNPKSGAIVPPKAALKPIYDKLQNVIRVSTKTDSVLRCPVGTESMKDEDIADNIELVYNTVVRGLPQNAKNVKAVKVKLSMGPFVPVGN